MIKIKIKSIFGKLLFEFEKENNTVKDTVVEALNKGADLRGADLRGADLQGVKIKNAAVFTGLYKYIVIPFISEDNVKYVKMGCYTRTVEEWDKDFWNNPNEFPNNGDEDSKMRLFAYETAKKWFDIGEKTKL